MKFLRKVRWSLVLLILLMAPACVMYDENGNVVTGPTTYCTNACYIRSANVCCPNGYLNYGGAGYGCYQTRQACLNASGGKCWYETSCIP